MEDPAFKPEILDCRIAKNALRDSGSIKCENRIRCQIAVSELKINELKKWTHHDFLSLQRDCMEWSPVSRIGSAVKNITSQRA